jgi:hypothetical protein
MLVSQGMSMSTTVQYLTRKANEMFERQMQYAAQKICERQRLFRVTA